MFIHKISYVQSIISFIKWVHFSLTQYYTLADINTCEYLMKWTNVTSKIILYFKLVSIQYALIIIKYVVLENHVSFSSLLKVVKSLEKCRVTLIKTKHVILS